MMHGVGIWSSWILAVARNLDGMFGALHTVLGIYIWHLPRAHELLKHHKLINHASGICDMLNMLNAERNFD